MKNSETFCRTAAKQICFAALCALTAQVCGAVDTSSAPGVVLDHQVIEYGWFKTAPKVFISDPEILILSNGDYLAAHALAGESSDSDNSGRTSVFRSTNAGVSWSKVLEITDLLRASMIEHNGAVYLIGVNNDATGNKAVIARSTDFGATWTKSALFSKGGSATPNNPVVADGRIWNAASTASFSAAADAANLLLDSAWILRGGFPAVDDAWPGGFIGEGQIAHSPDMGTFIIPKVKYEPLTALARICPVTGFVAFDPDRDFVALPGGEKKIGAGYDPLSGRFYALTQPILPIHSGSSIATDMIRNSAAILSSKNLYNWRIESFFLYSSRIDTDGFCYMNFDIDGDDMVLVSRTAWPVSGTSDNPRRGHDSNLLTFHRLENFRTIRPDYYLALSGGTVRRFERTPDPRDHDLPHGDFALGSSFDGAPLSSPDALGADSSSGDVYIRESGGRVLRFDALGNYIGSVASSPVALQTGSLTIAPPPRGECAWSRSSSGGWMDQLNWFYWGIPGTDEDIAVFGSAATGAATVTLPSISHDWQFNADGDTEKWTSNNVNLLAASGGLLSGQPATDDPYIMRAGQSFFGSDVPSVTVRLRVSTTRSFNLQFYWGTAQYTGYSGDRVVTAAYNGKGEFRDVVFTPGGHQNWDGQLIKSIRIDPVNGGTETFEIDSITVQRRTTPLKGVRFRHSHAYTLNGEGILELKSVSGLSTVEALRGQHQIAMPVVLDNAADFYSEPGSTLSFAAGLDLAGNTLSVTGSGLFLPGGLTMNSGILSVELGSTVTLNPGAIEYSGTLECSTPSGFSPAAGDTFQILQSTGGAFADTFSAVALPPLPDGLGWDSAELYSNGSVSIVLQAPTAWLSANNLPTDGSADFIDTDGDGMDNYSEWKAGTDPRDSSSRFLVGLPAAQSAAGFKVQWNGLSGRSYRIERSTNLLVSPPFQPLQTCIPGIDGILEFTDQEMENNPDAFYRVIIE